MAADDERRKLLAATALFGGLAVADLATVAGKLRPAVFAANQHIFSRGDESRDVYLVVEGRVRLSLLATDGRELSLIHATAGDMFGEFAAFDGSPRSADAFAITATTALVLPYGALRSLLETNPRVSAATIEYLCRRLRETNEKLEAIALSSIEVRIARFLLSAIALRGAKETNGEIEIDIAMSQGELALLVGASRPKTNVALAVLESHGAVVRNGSRFVCHLGSLRAVADAGQ